MPRARLRATHYARQRGLTVIELLVALVIGLGVIAAGLAFMMRSGESIRIGQEQAVNTSRGQQALARMVAEIKGVNIDAPPLYPVTPAFANLPRLPYLMIEKTPLYDPVPATGTAAPLIMPATPAARQFNSQNGAADLMHKWFPNPNPALNESNSLVFYKAPAPGAGGTSSIQRITYRLVVDNDPRSGYRRSRLMREVQNPLSDGSIQFHGAPAPASTVLADDVISIQFTYPSFEQQISAALDTQLTALAADPVQQTSYINENFRKVIGIRIVLGGARLGTEVKNQLPNQTAGVELKTEVRLRSE